MHTETNLPHISIPLLFVGIRNHNETLHQNRTAYTYDYILQYCATLIMKTIDKQQLLLQFTHYSNSRECYTIYNIARLTCAMLDSTCFLTNSFIFLFTRFQDDNDE